MSRNRDDESVGYKKPPKDTQFKPGQSGNPSGRPKMRVTTAELAQRQLRRQLNVNLCGQPKKISTLEAILMRHTNKALAGDLKSTTLLMDLCKSSEGDANNRLPELLNEFRTINMQHSDGAGKTRRKPQEERS